MNFYLFNFIVELFSGKKKPKRPCLYCGIFQSSLTRHMKAVHKNEEEVKAAMQLPIKDSHQAFNLLKRKGYHNYNLNKMKEDDFDLKELIKERQPRKEREEDEMENRVICSTCKGLFVKDHLKSHKNKCIAAEGSTQVPTAISMVTVRENDYSHEYKEDFLSKFRNDEAGRFCRSDKYIKDFGFHNYRRFASRRDKNPQNRLNTMKHMRMLANLFFFFKDEAAKMNKTVNESLDMFKRENFDYLMDAINSMAAKDEGGLKSGLKKNIGHLIKNVIEHIKGKYLLEGKKDEVEKIDEFKTIYHFYKRRIFDDAEYNCKKNRQENLRRPQNLPNDVDIEKLRNYLLSEISRLDNPYQFLETNEYTHLRDLVVCRLTLFNGKRGGEPSRLTLKEWNDAKEDAWIDDNQKKRVHEKKKQDLFKKYKLAYQSGKCVSQMLPILVIEDTWNALKKLSDPEIRQAAGVNTDNIYVFPSIKDSKFHVNGWSCVNKVCRKAELSKNINATQMRHYVSTVFANLDVPEEDRQAFYRHMGHSEQINKHVYQCPLGIQEVTSCGDFFLKIDNGKLISYIYYYIKSFRTTLFKKS